MLTNKSSGNKENLPCVSIIVTTFNRKDLLTETLYSILNQTYTNFELIVVDNMSQDGTENRVSDMQDERIKYFRNPNFGIIAVNRNFGIRKSSGKYIAFCDDDDLWVLEKLEKQVCLLEENSDVALCYTHAESFIGDKTMDKKMNRRNVRQNFFFQLLRGSYIPNSSVVIRRAVFQELGLLTENPQLREDYEMWLRVAKRYRFIGIDDSLIRYRVHASNVSSNLAKETLRAIRTLKSVAGVLRIPYVILWSNIAFQYLKYIAYVSNLNKVSKVIKKISNLR